MSTESRVVAVQERRELAPMTAMALLERREVVQRVIEEVMVEGVHYGTIPGTQELSLLKEGAEVLLSTFHIAVEPIVTDLSTPTEVRFQVECRGTHQGMFVGSGMGVCTSNEDKYRWRRPATQQEYDDADPTHRRIKYGRGKQGQQYKDPQVRQSPWNVYHTIMSMAQKRALVNLAKTVLAASECLKRAKLRRPTPPAADQGTNAPSHEWAGKATGGVGTPAKTAGTAPEGRTAQDPPRPATPPPSNPEAPISGEQVRYLMERIDQAGVPENAFLARFELGRIEELEVARYQAADAWITANSA